MPVHPGLLGSPFSALLLRKDADAAVTALRSAYSTRLQGDKCVIIGGIYRDAVRVCIGRHVFQPSVGAGINDAQDRAVGHISRC